jgi:hypothetical protein
MILRCEMPVLELGALSTRMIRWHKSEGEEVAYGDELCDAMVEEIQMVDRTQRASSLLGGRSKRKMAKAKEGPARTKDTNYVVRVISSDVGYLRRICAAEGEILASGQNLAVLTSESQEDMPSEIDGAWPVFRVIWDYEFDGS